jgi:hypothetical protein
VIQDRNWRDASLIRRQLTDAQWARIEGYCDFWSSELERRSLDSIQPHPMQRYRLALEIKDGVGPSRIPIARL